jgi:hypothetical protein
MTSPWEAPLLPDQGDDNENDTYLAVGKIISGWETIEFELSRLYSVFERDPDGLSMRKYGTPTITRLRLDGLLEAAERYFVISPDQELEGTLHELMIPLRALASRRNEIAHAIVMDISNIEAFLTFLAVEVLGRPHYAAIAPYHQIKQHDRWGLPAYAYTKANMFQLQMKMSDVYRRTNILRLAILLQLSE